MPTQSSMHFYLNWAKDRMDEMDATLASLESKVGEVQADARAQADQTLTDLRKKCDDFRDTIKKQSEANEAAWDSAKAQLEFEWSAFEAEVNKYVDSFGKQVEQQQAIFKLQAAAQLKAWHEAVDKLGDSAKEFAAERRGESATNSPNVTRRKPAKKPAGSNSNSCGVPDLCSTAMLAEQSQSDDDFAQLLSTAARLLSVLVGLARTSGLRKPWLRRRSRPRHCSVGDALSASPSHVVCSGRSTIVIYRASNARQRRNTKRATRNTEDIT